MEKLEPKLRFPEFKDVWKNEPIENYINLFSGIALKSDEISDDSTGIPILRGINITEGFIRHSKEIDKYYLGPSEKIKKYFVKENDLVLGMDGSKVGKNVALINKEDENSILIQRVARIRTNEKSNINYIFQQIFSKKFHDYVDIVNTSSGIPHISSQQIKDFAIGFPSLQEQTKIANFLSTLDEKLNLLKEKKTALEEYKKGMMQKIFSKEIRFKDDAGKDFSDWEENKFSNYIKLYRGSSPRPIIRFVTNSEDGVNWIKIGDTKGGRNNIIENVSEKITTAGAKKSRKVEVGEIILANSMSFGKSYILNISGCIYDGWFVLREYEKFFDKIFLIQLLNSEFLQKQYNTLSTGGVVQNISSEIVYSTLLLKPSLEEQKKIASFLSEIDKKIELVSIHIEDTEEYKKGLLQQMFC